jgi:hypothetical protein
VRRGSSTADRQVRRDQPRPGLHRLPDLANYLTDPEVQARISASLTREPAPIVGVRVDARGGFALVTG